MRDKSEGQGEEKSAHVFVPVEELSLAIGRDGQNVRLASKLTDYRIEIEEDPTASAKADSEGASKTIKSGEKKEPSSAKASHVAEALRDKSEGQGKKIEEPKIEEKKEAASAKSSGPASQSSSEASEPKEVKTEANVEEVKAEEVKKPKEEKKAEVRAEDKK